MKKILFVLLANIFLSISIHAQEQTSSDKTTFISKNGSFFRVDVYENIPKVKIIKMPSFQYSLSVYVITDLTDNSKQASVRVDIGLKHGVIEKDELDAFILFLEYVNKAEILKTYPDHYVHFKYSNNEVAMSVYWDIEEKSSWKQSKWVLVLDADENKTYIDVNQIPQLIQILKDVKNMMEEKLNE